MSSDKEEDQNVEEASQAGRDCREAMRGRYPVIASQSVAEAIRAIGVTEVTYYRWLRSDQVKRMKNLD
jgi:hypothetical protein